MQQSENIYGGIFHLAGSNFPLLDASKLEVTEDKILGFVDKRHEVCSQKFRVFL